MSKQRKEPMPPPEPKRRGRPRKDRGLGSELANSGHTSGKATKRVRFNENFYDKKEDGDMDDKYFDDDGKDDKGDDAMLRKHLEECDDYVDVSKISLD